MRQFKQAARAALGDDAPTGLVYRFAGQIENVDHELAAIIAEAREIRERLARGADDVADAIPGEVFSALAQLDHAGASGTISSRFERAVDAQARVRALSEGYHYGREA